VTGPLVVTRVGVVGVPALASPTLKLRAPVPPSPVFEHTALGNVLVAHVGAALALWYVTPTMLGAALIVKTVLVAFGRLPLAAVSVSVLPAALTWQPANDATPETGVTEVLVHVSEPVPVKLSVIAVP
jgi:hypothetical protein